MVRLMRGVRLSMYRRVAVSAGLFLATLTFVSEVAAQSSNPATLRQIIDRKNAEAAAATWAGHAGLPVALPTASGQGPDSSPGDGSSGPSGNSRSSGATAAAAASFAEGPGVLSNFPRSTNVRIAPTGQQVVPKKNAGQKVLAVDGRTANAGVSRITLSPDSDSASQVAVVTYLDGLLYVHGANSSLHDILRQISALTGMEVVGTLPEERVFGDQGPGSPSAVLSALLDGTKTNRLLRMDRRDAVTRLILTPRAGGASDAPPSDSQDHSIKK